MGRITWYRHTFYDGRYTSMDDRFHVRRIADRTWELWDSKLDRKGTYKSAKEAKSVAEKRLTISAQD
ncbi:MAG: hypothetical protein AMS18_09355 [Gemmatimonas sp. SG8_17]|nr:MAG: hypothetical protein AMS18_09355 [Gemmatimonas sp. SG8_17]